MRVCERAVCTTTCCFMTCRGFAKLQLMPPLGAFQAVHWSYWLVLGFRVQWLWLRAVTAGFLPEEHAVNFKACCPLPRMQGFGWSHTCGAHRATQQPQPMGLLQARLARWWQVASAHTIFCILALAGGLLGAQHIMSMHILSKKKAGAWPCCGGCCDPQVRQQRGIVT